MKPRFLLLLVIAAIALPMASHAQHHYIYHNIGDTIYNRDTIYHYQWWSDMNNYLDSTSNEIEVLIQPDPAVTYNAFGWTGVSLRYCYTPQLIHIKGIAGACVAFNLGNISTYVPDSTADQEYLYLYDACADSFPLKKAVPWHTTDPHRYMSLQCHSRPYVPCCENLYYNRQVVPIYEYYFDKSIPIRDSFYVGGSFYSNHNHIDPEDPTSAWNCQSMAYWKYGNDFGLDHRCDTCPLIPLQKYKYYLSSLYGGSWQWKEASWFTLIFPIVSIDTSYFYQDTTPYACPEVENFRIGSYGSGMASMIWNSTAEHVLWQISYGPSGISPEDGTIDSTASHFYNLWGIDSCTHYAAYIRAKCEHNGSVYYSDWSDSISIYLCNPTPPEGIGTGLLDQFTQLLPNPASSMVQVISSFQLKGIEIYDLKGRKALEQSADGITAAVDISNLAPGTYIAVIHSEAGTATKKLIVRSKE